MSDLFDHLRAAIGGRAPRRLGDPAVRRAGVIISLFERGGEPHLIFTRRSETLRNHAGQISFPGGGYEDADGSLERTALRETAEEIGLEAGFIEVLGALDDVTPVTSKFMVTPFVAIVPEPTGYRLNAQEVVEVLEVPLGVLLAQRDNPGVGPRGPYYLWRHHIIWGATARILRQFLALLP